jgi:two-component system, OmpR family, sensor histidine kinase BaeS
VSDPNVDEPRGPDRYPRYRDRRGRHGHPFGPDGPFGASGPFGPGGHWGGRRVRPKWWPQDEPWPPTSEFPWRKVRRRFIVRFAIGVSLIFTLVVLGPIVLIGQLLTATGLQPPLPGIAAVVVVLFLFAALSGTARGARRFAVPFGDLIEATGKVEAGDYTARVSVPNRGMREIRWLAEAFNSMAAHLETDERQRRSLLADVSHELRTPLAVLRGELEAMIDGVHPIDEANLSAAVDQIGMLTKLVEDLRTLALAEGGTLALHKEATDLTILVRDAAASFESLAAGAGVRLEIRMPEDLPLLDLDPLRIREVLVNLVANALRYAPTGSSVSITGETRRGTVRVSVTDAGPGIAPEVLPHLFERFARSEDSRGSGLGLAIARRLVEAHGGSIAAERPTGGGTAIRFELPTAATA